jgi:hypothetical protein
MILLEFVAVWNSWTWKDGLLGIRVNRFRLVHDLMVEQRMHLEMALEMWRDRLMLVGILTIKLWYSRINILRV